VSSFFPSFFFHKLPPLAIFCESHEDVTRDSLQPTTFFVLALPWGRLPGAPHSSGNRRTVCGGMTTACQHGVFLHPPKYAQPLRHLRDNVASFFDLGEERHRFTVGKVASCRPPTLAKTTWLVAKFLFDQDK